MRKSQNLFGYRIPLYFNDSKFSGWEKEIQNHTLSILGRSLPITWESIKFRDIKIQKIEISPEEAKIKLKKKMEEKTNNLNIIRKEENFSLTSTD